MIKTNNVLFLGAGASNDAGYPLVGDIFGELRQHCHEPIHNKLEQWKLFEKDLNFLSERWGVDFEKQNPEIILTLPNLLNAAHDDLLDRSCSQKNRQLMKRYAEGWDEGIWTKASAVTRLFGVILEDYFIAKHSEDSDRELPEYLFSMLDDVTCVLTTNWDTLAERVLLKKNKWFPADGYGFTCVMKELDAKNPGKQINYPPSKSKVLKLHGSIGWHHNGDDFYLRSDGYLQCLINNNNVCDANALRSGHGLHEDPLMLYPSYLKQLDNPILLSIWDEARKALETATSITIVGYSLPIADVAIRALLLSIRTNAAMVKIVGPLKNDERTRWESYFKTSGKQPIFVQEKAINYFK